MKVCTKCRESKPLSDFSPRKEAKTPFKSACRVCSAALRRGTPARKTDLMRKYGLTLKDYEDMLSIQNGSCTICHSPNPKGEPLFVDHCHETGAVRGLLCRFCNSGIGYFKDNILHLESAILYLKGQRR